MTTGPLTARRTIPGSERTSMTTAHGATRIVYADGPASARISPTTALRGVRHSPARLTCCSDGRSNGTPGSPTRVSRVDGAGRVRPGAGGRRGTRDRPAGAPVGSRPDAAERSAPGRRDRRGQARIGVRVRERRRVGRCAGSSRRSGRRRGRRARRRPRWAGGRGQHRRRTGPPPFGRHRCGRLAAGRRDRPADRGLRRRPRARRRHAPVRTGRDRRGNRPRPLPAGPDLVGAVHRGDGVAPRSPSAPGTGGRRLHLGWRPDPAAGGCRNAGVDADHHDPRHHDGCHRSRASSGATRPSRSASTVRSTSNASATG